MKDIGPLKKHERLLALTPAIALWGCFSGLCWAAVHLLLQSIWSPVLVYNFTLLSPVFQFQIIGLSALLLWVAGAIAADLFHAGRNSGPGPVRIGLLSGICTALVFISILVIHEMISHPPILHYPNDPLLIRMFLDNLFHQWLIPLAGFILVSAVIQVLSAYFHESRRGSIPDVTETTHKSTVSRIIHTHGFLLLAVIAALVVPPGLLYFGISTGVIAEQPGYSPIADSVDASRAGPDSIRIVMLPDAKKKHDLVPSVKIFIGEKDVSNQSMITRSGINASIDPPEGLRFQRNASVILQGRDVSGNETVPVHLRIMVMYPDTGLGSVICDRNI
jgi:hypothetical protein